jgi:hypothetical protein
MTKAKKSKSSIKISTLVFWLIIIMSVLIALLGLKETPPVNVINIFSDALKVLVGALAGAIAGEKKNE